jgi:hypothetical protein
VEEWVIIEEAPNFLISDEGRVKHESGRLVKVHVSSKGYPQVNLTIDGKYVQRTIHRLIAMAFVDGESKGLVARHIDGDRSNYSLKNLEWVTHEENREYARGRRRKLRKWIYVGNELIEIERE